MEKLKLFTIGFTKKPAEIFFGLLGEAGVRRVIDIRLNNSSQLAGFAKRDDLRFFLKAICGIDYMHMLELAPTEEILDEYRKKGREWAAYEERFVNLISERRIENLLSKKEVHLACLLCSEETPDRCHRRLVAEHLKEKWGNLQIVHLT
ncbi:MAG: DUF488 domain-containing protein [Syntrophobacteraceae bacterium]|jgi:uncharacterized protein (DUF488 family)